MEGVAHTGGWGMSVAAVPGATRARERPDTTRQGEGPVRRQAETVHVVVPLFDEEAILPALHDRLVVVLEDLPCDWRVTYVDDGSRDRTPTLLGELCRADPRVSALHLSRNFGQQLAIGAGLSVASGDAVILMDGDLQDPPEVIPRLLQKWEEGYEVVYAVKRERKENLLKRSLFALFYANWHFGWVEAEDLDFYN